MFCVSLNTLVYCRMGAAIFEVTNKANGSVMLSHVIHSKIFKLLAVGWWKISTYFIITYNNQFASWLLHTSWKCVFWKPNYVYFLKKQENDYLCIKIIMSYFFCHAMQLASPYQFMIMNDQSIYFVSPQILVDYPGYPSFDRISIHSCLFCNNVTNIGWLNELGR